MSTNLMMRSRIHDFFEPESTPRAQTSQLRAMGPQRPQTTSVRFCSRSMNVHQFRALVDLYNDEQN